MSTHTAGPAPTTPSFKTVLAALRTVRFTATHTRARMKMNITGAGLFLLAFALLLVARNLTGTWTPLQWAQAVICLAAQPYFIARVSTARRALSGTRVP